MAFKRFRARPTVEINSEPSKAAVNRGRVLILRTNRADIQLTLDEAEALYQDLLRTVERARARVRAGTMPKAVKKIYIDDLA